MEYKLVLFAASAIIALIIARRLLTRWVFNKLVNSEMNYVLNHPNCKVKGRFE